MQRTLAIIKPDGVARGVIGEVIKRIEQNALKIVAMKLIQMTKTQAQGFYAVHEGKPFFEPLIKYITSAPVVVMAFEGPQAVQAARNTIGATKPVEATAGSIRGDFGMMVGRNLVHGSDSPENAKAEIALWFAESELIGYEREVDRWILE